MYVTFKQKDFSLSAMWHSLDKRASMDSMTVWFPSETVEQAVILLRD